MKIYRMSAFFEDNNNGGPTEANDECIFKRRHELDIENAKTKCENGAGEVVNNAVPDDFFDDLLVTASANIKTEKGTEHTDQMEPAEIRPQITVKQEKPDLPTTSANDINAISTRIVTTPTVLAPASTLLNPSSALLESRSENMCETGTVSCTADYVKPELLEGFFDELLVDKVSERLENFVNEDIEIKFAEKVKELEKLKELERQNEQKKKHKQKKKKRKEEKAKKRERCYNEFELEDEDARKRQKRGRHSNSHSPQAELPSTSRASMPRADEPVRLPLNVANSSANNMEFPSGLENEGDFRIKLKKVEELTVAPVPPKELTIEEKMNRALSLAYSLCSDDIKAEEEPLFYHTSTIRKLPSSTSMYERQSYEDRSPLNVVNNVSYTFNCNSTNIKLHDYGLEQLPLGVRDIARKIGLDASTIHEKLASLKRIILLDKESSKKQSEEMVVEPTGSSLYSNALIQTDCSSFSAHNNAHDMDTQTELETYDIAVQTTQSGASGFLSDDLPLVRLLKKLNDNQLMAMQDFGELLLEPSDPSNSMERYSIRQRMLEIYEFANAPIKPNPRTLEAMSIVPPFELPVMSTHMHRPPADRNRDSTQYASHSYVRQNNFEYNHINEQPPANSQRYENVKQHDPRTIKFYGRGALRRH